MDLKKLLIVGTVATTLSLWIGYEIGEYTWDILKNFVKINTNVRSLLNIPAVDITGADRNAPKFKVKDLIALLPAVKTSEFIEKIKHSNQEETIQTPPPKVILTTIVISKERVAVIDGKIFKEGDTIHSGERIVKITKEGVLLDGRWGKRWVYIER